MANSNPYKNIDINKIGTGGHYMAGSFSSRKRMGLAGELRKLARAKGKFSYGKNLSDKNLKDIHTLVGKELANLPKSSAGLSRKARARIMAAGRKKLLNDPKFSSADLKDLRQITVALSKRESSQKAEITREMRKQSLAEAKKQQHIKAHISQDIAQEAWEEERSGNKIHHDPRSALGKFKSSSTKNNANQTRSKKIDLVV